MLSKKGITNNRLFSSLLNFEITNSRLVDVLIKPGHTIISPIMIRQVAPSVGSIAEFPDQSSYGTKGLRA
jgi:hypothetical protein